MKLPIFTFLFLLSLIINAQTYKPLLNEVNEWQFTNCNTNGCLDNTYYTDGDTLNGGYQYKVLNGFHFISRTFWLREDSLNQKVYLSYDAGTRREELLYDFSLQVGDSINIKNPITPFITSAGHFTVDSILMDLLQDGIHYRHYYLSPSLSNTISTNTAEWIEGVGSLSLINAPSGFPDVNDVGKLSCFFKNGNLFYSNLDSIENCSPNIVVILDVNTDQPKFDELKVFPTFVHNQCHIIGIKAMENLNIYSVNGKLIMHKSVHNTTQIDLDLRQLNSGIYFLVLSDNHTNQRSFKIIKK